MNERVGEEPLRVPVEAGTVSRIEDPASGALISLTVMTPREIRNGSELRHMWQEGTSLFEALVAEGWMTPDGAVVKGFSIDEVRSEPAENQQYQTVLTFRRNPESDAAETEAPGE